MRKIKFRYVCEDANGDIFTFITSIEDLERAKLNVNTYGHGRIEVIKARNQFANTHDKNGKEIYEGDIIKRKEFGSDYGRKMLCVVFYRKDIASWCMKEKRNASGTLGLTDGSVINEVIGNIYENPELLKEAK